MTNEHLKFSIPSKTTSQPKSMPPPSTDPTLSDLTTSDISSEEEEESEEDSSLHLQAHGLIHSEKATSPRLRKLEPYLVPPPLTRKEIMELGGVDCSEDTTSTPKLTRQGPSKIPLTPTTSKKRWFGLKLPFLSRFKKRPRQTSEPTKKSSEAAQKVQAIEEYNRLLDRYSRQVWLQRQCCEACGTPKNHFLTDNRLAAIEKWRTDVFVKRLPKSV